MYRISLHLLVVHPGTKRILLNLLRLEGVRGSVFSLGSWFILSGGYLVVSCIYFQADLQGYYLFSVIG
ncbi:hypothetical protein OAN13_05990 [Opitutales bacterium]|nr:hypothetical protein [Opitutales bacterium]